MTWDKTTPVGGEALTQGDDRIREMKQDLETALQACGAFPISTSSPEYRPRGQSGVTGSRPAAASGGLYFNTTYNAMDWSDGSAWHVVSIPSGTKAIFYQASAPTGWTRDTTAGLNNKFMGIVTGGSPGTTGGSADLGSESSHTHGAGSLQFQVFRYDLGDDAVYGFASGGTEFMVTNNTVAASGGGVSPQASAPGSDTYGYTKSGAGTSGTGSSHTHTHGFSNHEVLYALVATKDA